MVARTVLGIDAAWTSARPSGVALVAEGADGWRLAALASSYEGFGGGAAGEDLVARCRDLLGVGPDVVAIDMPLSLKPIVGRRVADDAVSHAFGAAKCGTHSPSPERPGVVGRRLQERLEAGGCRLSTLCLEPPCAIEVYPHPALLRLTGETKRLRYKVGRTSKYWPGEPLERRRALLADEWARIVSALGRHIDGVADALPLPGSDVRGGGLKDFEDRLDAVICAWVGIEALEGKAEPYGDADAAVWVPSESADSNTDSR